MSVKDDRSPVPARGPAAGAGALLVVDDNPVNRELLKRRLKVRGYAVDAAEDGQRALALLQGGGYELVLLDLGMPGMGGTEVLQTLRQTATPEDLPVIMATAKDSGEDVLATLALGANDYVTKPLDFQVVLARIEAQLELKRARDEARRLRAELEALRGSAPQPKAPPPGDAEATIVPTARRSAASAVEQAARDTAPAPVPTPLVAPAEPPAVAPAEAAAPAGLRPGAERRQVTVLMSDLRGFMSIADRLEPEKVVALLNHYLGVMVEIIGKHGGCVEEFLGDGILAAFGYPVHEADDAARAVACAISMQRAMDGVAGWCRGQGLPELEMGVALHTGEAIVGQIGTEKRPKWGTFGAPLDLVSRLETYTVGGQVLISEATFKAAGPEVRASGQMAVRTRAAAEPVTAFEVRGLAGKWSLFLTERAPSTIRLERPVSAHYFTFDGRSVAGTASPVLLLGLSTKGAELTGEEVVPVGTDILLRLLAPDGKEIPGDLYATVIARRTRSAGSFAVRFTSMPPEVEIFIKRRLGITT